MISSSHSNPIGIPLNYQSSSATETLPSTASNKRTFTATYPDTLPAYIKPLTSLTIHLKKTYENIRTTHIEKTIEDSNSLKEPRIETSSTSSEVILETPLDTPPNDLRPSAFRKFHLLVKHIQETRSHLGLPPLSYADLEQRDVNPPYHRPPLLAAGFDNILLIGEGTSSFVFKCRKKSSSKEYAIKISNSIHSNLDLISESTLLNYIKSKSIKNKDSNIIKTGKPFLLKDRIVLPMELCKSDLYSLMINQKKISLFKISQITKQMLSALSFLKNISLIHGDIKPNNILISQEKPFCIKLADFGLSQVSPVTYHIPLQTICYRSPELILQKLPYTYPIDIWSLGCILFEMQKHDLYFFPTTNESDLILEQQALLGPYPDPLPPIYAVHSMQKSIASHMNETSLTSYETEAKKNKLIDLIEKMLEFKGHERISPEEALAHPFLLHN